MRGFSLVLFALIALIPLVAPGLEPTSPGVRGNLREGGSLASGPSVGPESLTITFRHRNPTGSFGLVDAITGAVAWQPLQKFRASGSPDMLFPCSFTFRCSVDKRIIKYCSVMTDNRASYRMNIDVNGLVHVFVDGPGRQSVAFEAEGLRKRIHVYGRSHANEAWCGIEP